MKAQILLADDNSETLQNLQEAITDFGYVCEVASNGDEALEKFKKSEFQILIANLTLPPLSGNDLIAKTLQIAEYTICIVISDISDPEVVISAMREHKAYDFFVKPVNLAILKNRLENALEFYRLKKKMQNIVASEDEHFRKILEIFDWKRELQKKQYESLASKIIRQINISLFHGGGFGGLLSVTSLILSKTKQNSENKKFEISENQRLLLQENYESAKNLVNGFNKAQAILMNNEFVIERILLSELPGFFETLKEKVGPMLKLKNQKLSISSLPRISMNREILFNREMIEAAFTELLINSMKYSNESDLIYIVLFLKDDFFEMKFLNPAYANSDGSVGIAGANEQMVFEPFYRLSAISFDGYTLEEFGAGIGLTVVKKILELHRAEINIFTIKNFLPGSNEIDVSVSIRFPLQPEIITQQESV